MHAVSSPRHVSSLQTTASRPAGSLLTNIESEDINMAAALECLKSSQEILQHQLYEISELKVCAALQFY